MQVRGARPTGGLDRPVPGSLVLVAVPCSSRRQPQAGLRREKGRRGAALRVACAVAAEERLDAQVEIVILQSMPARASEIVTRIAA